MPRNKNEIRDFYSQVITAAEAAKFLKVSERSFYRLVEQGVIPKSGDGGYMLGEVVEAFWTNNGGNAKTFQEERTRLTKAQADLAEMELAEQRGELLNAQAVLKVWSDDVINAKTRLLAIPSKAAPELAGLGILEIQAKLKIFIHEALKELSEYDARRIKNAAIALGK